MWRQPSAEIHPEVIAAQFITETLQKHAPTFFQDDVEHGRPVVTAAIALAETLIRQRRRFTRSRPDETRTLLHALTAFISANEGTAVMASRLHYDMLMDAWVQQSPRAMVSLDENDDDDCINDEAELVIIAWRSIVTEQLGHVPGVCMTSTRRRRHVPSSVYDKWQAMPTATSISSLCDISYTLHDGMTHDDVARQGLKPLIDAVAAMRAMSTVAAVHLDWTLCVDCDERVFCTMTYRVYDVQ